MKRGFTILELLVASLLLSMLVTMLTMIFNQSSIAWHAGLSSVRQLDETRMQMGGYHYVIDDVLPGVGQTGVRFGDGTTDNRQLQYRTVSLFRNWNGKGQISPGNVSANCSGRLVDLASTELGYANLGSTLPITMSDDVRRGKSVTTPSQGGGTKANDGIIVGVRSWGPDGKEDTADDITTFPEDVD